MPKNVAVGNAIVSFPDSMDDASIKQILQSRAGELAQYQKKPLPNLGAATGISAPHGLLEKARSAYNRYAPQPIRDAVDTIKTVGNAMGLSDPMSVFGGPGATLAASGIVGKMGKATEEAIPIIKNLIGRSVLVDRRGNPKTLYHGTDVENIDQFITPAFFSTDKGLSANYGKNVGEYHIKAENPFYHPSHLPGAREGYVSKKEFVDALKEDGVDVKKAFYKDSDYADEGLYDPWELYNNSEVIDAIKKAGHDSLYLPEEGKDTYAVFSPDQIIKKPK